MLRPLRSRRFRSSIIWRLDVTAARSAQRHSRGIAPAAPCGPLTRRTRSRGRYVVNPANARQCSARRSRRVSSCAQAQYIVSGILRCSRHPARRRGEEFPLQRPRRPKHRAGADLVGRKSGKRERARSQEWLSPIAIERCGQAIEAIETLVVSEAVKVIVVVGCERHWRTPTKAAKLTAPCEGTSAQTFGLPAFPPRGLSFGLSRRASAAPALPMHPRWTLGADRSSPRKVQRCVKTIDAGCDAPPWDVTTSGGWSAPGRHGCRALPCDYLLVGGIAQLITELAQPYLGTRTR